MITRWDVGREFSFAATNAADHSMSAWTSLRAHALSTTARGPACTRQHKNPKKRGALRGHRDARVLKGACEGRIEGLGFRV